MDSMGLGAMHRAQMETSSGGWQTMDSAPHDGTIIEVMCTYGTAPWYSLARWVPPPTDGTPAWVPSTGGARSGWQTWDSANNGRFGWSGFVGSSHLKWRPYSGPDPAVAGAGSYVDPTGGRQNTDAYWRGAVASKYGLPLDHFEKSESTKRRKEWWQWFFGG